MPADPPRGAGVAMLVALRREAAGLLAAERWRPMQLAGTVAAYRRDGAGASTVLVVTGVARERATAAARAVLADQRPRAVLSMGFAGGLMEGQRPGDLIIAESLLPAPAAADGQTAPRMPVHADSVMLERAPLLASRLGLRHSIGLMLTAGQVVSGPQEKRRLGAETGATAVDMESYWIGAECREMGVPFLTVRAIVDTVDDHLPADVARLALGSGLRHSRRLAALKVALHPWWASGLVRMGRAARQARDSLTAFAMSCLETSMDTPDA